MHTTIFNASAQDVLNSQRNKKWCTCTAHQLQILVSFVDCYFSEALRTKHFTV